MNINLNSINDINKLRDAEVKTKIFLSGKIFTARDAAHKRIIELVKTKKAIPLDLNNSIIYYMGPTPTRDNYSIGSCGPTSSYRMDKYLEDFLKLGVIATIGKGERDSGVNKIIKKYKSPYLVAIGGAGAYLAKCVVSSKTILFEDLQAEAIRELIVKDFPVIVGIDIRGDTIFDKIKPV